jgi:hypothetical protein
LKLLPNLQREKEKDMATYTDLFMRPNLTSPQGQTPSQSPVTSCPDIIPAGTSPTANFQTVYSSASSYASDPGQSVVLGTNNYIYVRANNGWSGAETGQVYLYYVPAQVINWPSEWAGNQLLTDQVNSQGQNLPYLALNAQTTGQIVVGGGVFQWIPQPPPPGSDHYCLISQITTANTPNPIPGQSTPMTYEDMATIVANDLGFGWRNVVLIDNGDAPTWSYQTMLTVPSNVTAEVVHVYLACNNMATGGAMAFTASTTAGSSAPVTIPQTTINDANQISGVTVTLQPGYSASITVSYWSNNTTSPSGASIALEASIESGGNPGLAALVNPQHVRRLSKANGITPTLPVYIGQDNFKYQY